MTVKSKRGRYRYVAFRVSPGLTKPALISRVREACRGGSGPYVVQAGGGMAVVRCAPGERDRVAEIMAAADAGSESLRTSGTLRSLRDRYPELEQGKKRSHQAPGP
ncbi:MAG: hypothetical protein LBG62_01995 [Candidatus Methanoplasma sp.]|jgi:RNase P/RNase MRP subunit POP5|nr:hypothetical protein [Candidatus Methanoplasma sp.]